MIERTENIGCGFALAAAVAVLIYISIPTGQGCGRPAWLIQTNADLQNVVIGIKGFQSEYNHLPVEVLHGVESTPSAFKGEILECLMKRPQHPANPRHIGFFEAKPARKEKNGIYVTTTGVPVFADFWGHPYYVVLDTNGDGKIPNPARGHPVSRGSTELEPDELELDVIAFSAGPDGNPDTWEDNIKSWR